MKTPFVLLCCPVFFGIVYNVLPEFRYCSLATCRSYCVSRRWTRVRVHGPLLAGSAQHASSVERTTRSRTTAKDTSVGSMKDEDSLALVESNVVDEITRATLFAESRIERSTISQLTAKRGCSTKSNGRWWKGIFHKTTYIGLTYLKLLHLRYVKETTISLGKSKRWNNRFCPRTFAMKQRR